MVTTEPGATRGPAHVILKGTGLIWYLTAAVGQAGFIYFILGYYGSRTVRGDFAAWDEKPVIDAHIPGDHLGNAMFAAHVFFAAVITLGGLLQLVPQIRSAAPWFHRYSGRVFMVIAYGMALNGMWLVVVRESYLAPFSSLGTMVNAILILVVASIAWRLAMQRRIDEHRRWAMRLFMLVNGVWFLRVFIMAWIVLNQGTRGMNETMTGPADLILSFACYLVPLAILEVYFRAQRAETARPKLAAAGLVFASTLLMGVGIFGTFAFMWAPYL